MPAATLTVRHEKRGILALASLFAFRMLGLFMILPVFSLYATTLAGSTPFLMGIAFGAYGLTQAIFQIPFGFFSDKWGRKPLITIGLILFAIGSIVAALSTSIYGTILGRALQGMGAIGSTLIAYVADLTPDEHRTKAMALVGMMIGLSFMLAMVLGSWLSSLIGVPGLFWFTAGLACTGIVMLYTAVPNPPNRPALKTSAPNLFRSVLTNIDLLRLDLGIFFQHAILTSSFIVIPIVIIQHLQWDKADQWEIYLPVFLISFALMLPFIILAEKKKKQKPIFLGAIFTLALSQILMSQFQDHASLLISSLVIFFTAFNLLEATLPSLISKLAPAESKGTAMGIYSTFQFLGIFCGGAGGGWLYQQFELKGVFLGSTAMALLWLLISAGMPSKTPAKTTDIP